MGYSKHIRAFKRVQDQLDVMVEANTDVEWTSDDPAKLAYHIREGIHVAQLRAQDDDEYNDYARLESKYIVRTGPQKVIAELRDGAAARTLRKTLSTMNIAGVVDALTIVGAAIKHKAPELHFPDAIVSEDELEGLYNWATKHQYVLIIGEGITLSQTAPQDIGWTPSQNEE